MAPKRLYIGVALLVFVIFLHVQFHSMTVLALFASYFVAFVIIVYAVNDVFRAFRDSLVFQPDSPPHSRSCVASPQVFSLLFEEFFVPARDGVKLHFYFVKGKNAEEEKYCSTPPPTVLFLHGNSGNIGHRLPNVDLIVRVRMKEK